MDRPFHPHHHPSLSAVVFSAFLEASIPNRSSVAADGATRLFFHNVCKKILKVARKTIINILLFSRSASRSCRDKLCQQSPMTCVRFLQLSAKYANINAVPNSLWTWYLSRTTKCHICVGQIHHNIHSVKVTS